LPKEAELKDYIAKHLRVKDEVEGTVAQVDPNRSCVRLVSSENAGMG